MIFALDAKQFAHPTFDWFEGFVTQKEQFLNKPIAGSESQRGNAVLHFRIYGGKERRENGVSAGELADELPALPIVLFHSGRRSEHGFC